MRAALVLFALVATAAYVSAADDVLVLGEKNFDSMVNPAELMLVEFYAPWCGHCKKLAPEYEKAATELLKNDPPVRLAKVDCTEENAVCSRHGVQGYPTLKIFRSGVASEYNGPREARGIVNFMRKQAGPASVPVENLAGLTAYLKKNSADLVVLGLFADKTSAGYKLFSRVSSAQRDNFKFVESSSEDLFEKYGRESVVVIRAERFVSKWDEAAVVKSADALNDRTFEEFIYESALTLVSERNRDNQDRFTRSGKPVVTLYCKVDYEKDPKGTNYIANRLRRVAADLKEDFVFAVANKDDFRYEIEEFGLDASAPFSVSVKNQKGQKFGFKEASKDGKLFLDNLKNWLSEVNAGNVEPHLKSEPIPDNEGAAVKTLVARNFDEVVMDNDKDVLIEFYAPWCGHCKNLAPTWEELGEKMSSVDSVVIAKMDATANDVPPQFEVRGFPTLYFVPGNDKMNPRPYRGGRDLKDFVDFLKKEATTPFNLNDAGEKKKSKKSKKKDDL